MSVTALDGLSITVLSVDLDAWPVVQAEHSFFNDNDPPAIGLRDVMVRVRVQNVGGSATVEQDTSASDFKFVASAVLYTNSCGVIPDELNAKLFLGGSVEGNVCVQLPVDGSGIVMIYEPFLSIFSSGTADRRWLKIGQPVSLQAPSDISTLVDIDASVPQGFARTNAVPPGMSVTTLDGLSITVLSVDLDAWPVVQAEHSFFNDNDPPAIGLRDVMVRVRVQNVGGSATVEQDTSASDFKFVASAVLYTNSCGVIPDELNAKLFLGGSVEGNVCVQLPVDGSGIVMIYEPFLSIFSSGTADRRWLGLSSNTD